MKDGTAERAEAFLIQNGLHESCVDFDAQAARFAGQMDAGLRGDVSSLQMAPTYLDAGARARGAGSAIAIDAGGTNLRIALTEFGPEGIPELVYQEKYPTPGSEEAIAKDGFFDSLVRYMGPILDKSDRIGLCFSFPSEILPDRGARILNFNKELRVSGAAGALIRPELSTALRRAGKQPKRVTVLNDTAAALLGELAVMPSQRYSGYVGLIYGTGLNICYREAIANIAKLGRPPGPADIADTALAAHMLINTECGGYDGFEQSACDRAIDLSSVNPGDHIFEKMMSGAYYGAFVSECLRHAANSGFFETGLPERVRGLGALTAADAAVFMESPAGGNLLAGLCRTNEDRMALTALLDGLYDRAAKMLAAAAFAVMRRSGGGTPGAPVCLVTEGSSFKKAYRFRERFESMLHRFAGGGLYYELIAAENHTLFGAASAALRNS
ncbi:MAG: hypothetical protein LBS85_00970 [Clostridiales Family XIII bacterium]|jgi:hexokinase|nr:hypothetical protein [Clostridiales Family XIII bacterium]